MEKVMPTDDGWMNVGEVCERLKLVDPEAGVIVTNNERGNKYAGGRVVQLRAVYDQDSGVKLLYLFTA
jgi:hypothetical protein